jgi:hypothetical protein
LLNWIESLTADLRQAQAENLYSREQLHRRQAGGGQPNPSQDRFTERHPIHSEKERAEPSDRKQHSKGSKLDRIRIDREDVLRLSLPPDAQFKDYEDLVVQELRIATDHVKFREEKFECPLALA